MMNQFKIIIVLKKNLKGAFSNEKTELYLTNIKPMFEEISTNLADNIKLTMVSIYNSIETSTSNDW